MDISKVWESLARESGGDIIYLIMDGVGGLPHPETGKTELQTANTPNLDRLAKESICGLLEMIGPGITPGSGPGHLALFGYDPFHYAVGRGILSALGIGFDLHEGDVAARGNFATIDHEGRVTDRRAGRLSTEENRRICEKIRNGVTLSFGGEMYFETVSEHRALLVLRGEGLHDDLETTDPQKTGVRPYDPTALSEQAAKTSRIVAEFIRQAKEILSDEKRASISWAWPWPTREGSKNTALSSCLDPTAGMMASRCSRICQPPDRVFFDRLKIPDCPHILPNRMRQNKCQKLKPKEEVKCLTSPSTDSVESAAHH